MSLEDYKNIADIAQAVVTTCAIMLGGIWTYFLFVKKRISYPIVDLELSYHKVELPNGKILVHAAVKVDNTGSVLLKIKEAELRLRKVKPLPSVIRLDGGEELDPIYEGETELPWPLLVERKWGDDSVDMEIEPGESDTLHADYILSEEIEVIQFYFHLKNKAKKELGWQLIEFIDLTEEDRKMTDTKHTNTTPIGDGDGDQTAQVPQQKQQKPQQQQKPKQKPVQKPAEE